MSLSLSELKKHIYENELIEKLLNELGCEDYRYNPSKTNRDDLITARLPDSDNYKSVQIYVTPNLHTELVTRGISGDIYILVGYLRYDTKNQEELQEYLYEIKTYICNVLEIEDSGFTPQQPKTNHNSWLKEIRKNRKKDFETQENVPIPDKVLNQYVSGAWHEWVANGISPTTQIEFGIGVDVRSERVTIPIHNRQGKLIGVKGRYFGSDPVKRDERKYAYLYPCSKTLELYNLHRATPYIKEKKYVIVVEGAKTALALWDWGYKNCVSIEGDRISAIQVKLLKDLGIDIDFLFAWDKGKDKTFISDQLKQIKGRKIKYLYDTQGIFEDKDSPIDKGREVFDNYFKDNQVIFQ